jgi:hypothetical protein
LWVDEVNSSAIKTAVEIIDDWDDSNYCNVNINLAGTDVTGGAGAVAAGTPRMTLASDDPAVTALQIMDDWDESDRAKVNIIAGQAGVAAGAGAVDALTQRTTLASDDPAVTALQIIDDWDDGSDRCQIDIAAQSLTAVKISKDTAANSYTNPIYVTNVAGAVSATEIHDYATTVDTGNNDYTVTGTTFLLKSVIFAASGGMKATIQTGPVGTLVDKAVGFIAHQGGTQQLFFDPPIEVPVTSTGTVRVIMTNREGSAQNVYSTIIGNDLP